MQKAIYQLKQSHCGICVKKKGSHYLLGVGQIPPITLVKADTLLFELPQDKPFILDGEVMKPSGKFFQTAETIDPYHIILDISDLSILSFVQYIRK